MSEIDRWLEGEGDRLVERLGIQSGHRVLDFGCGFGSIVIPAARVVGPQGRVLALDVDEAPLEAIRRRIAGTPLADRIDLVRTTGEARFPGVEEGQLDAVFLFDVLQHIADHTSLFAECRRTLRPGGSLHINATELSHPGKVDVAEMIHALNAAGFREAGSVRMRLMHYRRMEEDIVRNFIAGNAR